MLILIAVALTLALLELGLRAVSSKRTTPIYVSHEQAVVQFRPFLHKVRGTVHLKTNRLGLRDERGDYAGRDTVLLFGDSNVAGLFCDFEDTLGQQLERALAERGLDLEVINFGLPGYSPELSLARFQHALAEGLELGHVRAAVLHVFADNDYGDILRNNLLRPAGNKQDEGQSFLLAAPDAGRIEPSLHWLNTAYHELVLFRRLFNLGADIFGGSIYEVCASLAGERYYFHDLNPLRRKLAQEGERREVRDFYLSKLLEYDKLVWQWHLQRRHTSWLQSYYDVSLALDADPQRKKRTEAMLQAVFTQFRELAEANGIYPLLLLQPSEFDVADSNYITPETLKQFAQENGLDYAPSRLTDLALQAAEKSGIECVNLFSKFSTTNGNYYNLKEMGVDDHWNVVGMSRAADTVADVLAKQLGGEQRRSKAAAKLTATSK